MTSDRSTQSSILLRQYANTAFAAVAAAVLLSGCSDGSVPAAVRPAESTDTAPVFVNKVWSVSESSGVAPGTLYVFLAEGTLVIASANSKPALGAWRYEGGALTMVEEGIAYKVDVLELNKNEFRIRSHNPGEPVDITLVPAQ